MNPSEPFIRRPVATTLLTIAVGLAGAVAYNFLPVSPLPQVDFPTINVFASLPGASPETMASSVATPLERQFSRIAGVTEMSSSSSLANTSVTLQFDLNRNIDAAARDVQAAINAARGYLPTSLPQNPRYRKVNPADAPIFILALTSQVLDKGQMYDAASTIMAQKLSQVSGVGQVIVGGSALPAVRVELNPTVLNKYGVGFEQVRTALATANANVPKGHFSDAYQTWEVGANDQILHAADYRPIIVTWRNGTPVRLAALGEVIDSVEDVRNAGYSNGQPSVLLIIFRQPGANIIHTVDNIRAALPQLEASIPRAIHVHIAMDQTVTIRASVIDVEATLAIAVVLVVLVVFLFLRSPRMTTIPAVAVPISLIGAVGGMYLAGFSIDNLSLMALTISTGFVVDDAIVVIENITRYLEQGMRPFEAALHGAGEIAFTVLSISLSLIAVFIPLLLMGGIVGRLFREFAVTLSMAIFVSMLVSLTTTPMMCAHLLRQHESHGRLYNLSERAFQKLVDFYGRTLNLALKFSPITLLVLAATIVLNVFLYIYVPKGFFPQQDNGRVQGSVQADQDTSFQAMDNILRRMIHIVGADPAVDTVIGFTGGGGVNTARMFIALKPLNERQATADQIIGRLRPRLARVPGATLYLQASQDVRVGGRMSNAEYQFTLRGDNVNDLTKFAPMMLAEMLQIKIIADVNSDQQNRGLETQVTYNRDSAARFGISPQLIDDVLYDAFGQRPVSTMYTSLNQYHVIMEAAPQFWQNPQTLREIYVRAPASQMVPLNSFATYVPQTTALAVTHQGLFPAATISFNLQPGTALGDAVREIDAAATRVHLPASIQTGFAGTAQAYQESLASEPYLIAAALVAVYLVLGILYESVIHPITILSTLPSAGVGALLALLLTHTELSIIAMIGIILLIGIVKKNAIMMVDFALAAERNEGKNARDSIYEACMLRFRPILMTTMAALLGAVPLAIGTGTGSELRRPLGLTIIGGLIVSQVLTLYTTPAVYMFFDFIGEGPAAWRRAFTRLLPWHWHSILALLLPLFLAGCMIGPKYKRPAPASPMTLKEPPPAGWKEAQPADGVLKGKWWEMFGDPELNALEERVAISNQNVLQAAALYREAHAAVTVARSALFPVVTSHVSITESHSAGGTGVVTSGGTVSGGGGSGNVTSYNVNGDISWAPDLWGNLRRAVTAGKETSQAFAADLANARLLYQAELASDYFQLHSIDTDQDLLRRTIASYQDFLKLTQDRFQAGVASDLDIAQAETQLYSTQAQLTDLIPQRAAFEHAIAVLTGQAPAQLTLAPKRLTTPPPRIPVGVASALLERRPDIAGAERRVAAANEQIGIAKAAYFPTLTLGLTAGFQSTSFTNWISWPSRFWSLGPALAETLVDFGRRHGLEAEAVAAYDALVSGYRQTVLVALQQVEDQLAALRELQVESAQTEADVAATRRALELSTLQYKAGTVSYLQVITAQTAELAAERSAISLWGRRLVAAVTLIEALGGGWNTSQLPAK